MFGSERVSDYYFTAAFVNIY